MSERAATRYAKAVLSLANTQNSDKAVNDDMKSIAHAAADSKELNDMLHSPVITTKVKKSALLAIFPNMNALSVNLINTLIINKRLNILGSVAHQYNTLFDAAHGTQIAKVITAVPLTDDLKAKVLLKVKELTGDNAELINTVDASILGGFILRVGDIQYNASIANKLNKLKREFTLN